MQSNQFKVANLQFQSIDYPRTRDYVSIYYVSPLQYMEYTSANIRTANLRKGL